MNPRPERDAGADRRDTLWVAGMAAFVASLVLDHFLPTTGFGLARLAALTAALTAVLYFALRPFAAQVADATRRRPPAPPPGSPDA